MRKTFAVLKNKINVRKTASWAVLVLALILLVVGGVMLVRDYDMERLTATLSQRAEDLERVFTFQGNDRDEVIPDTEDPEEEEEEVFERPVTMTAYREKAGTGEGLTHLARRALASYLRETGKSLSAEQKVYAEDYIQMRIPLGRVDGGRWLELGEEVEISQDLIEEALTKAGQLTETELVNLSYYANLAFPG